MNSIIVISLTVILLVWMVLDTILKIQLDQRGTMKDAIIGAVISAVSVWYAKCPGPRLYRWITDKFI